jgi:hypothetical protein
MAGQRITIRLHGAVEDDGHIRLTEFIKQLEAVKAALKQTERLITKSEERSLYYKIVDLSHSSPATIVIEATPLDQNVEVKVAAETVTKFFSNLRQVKRGRVPSNIDLPALLAYRNLGSMLEQHVSEVDIINSEQSISIDEVFKSKVTEIIGPDERVEGSMSGTLEWLNLHNTNRFHIYPTIGPKKVDCDFPPPLRDKVIAAIARYVLVIGELRYKKLSNFPYAIDVRDIEVLPPEDELPTLYDLRGIAPDATGNMTSAEFIRSIRDEENW